MVLTRRLLLQVGSLSLISVAVGEAHGETLDTSIREALQRTKVRMRDSTGRVNRVLDTHFADKATRIRLKSVLDRLLSMKSSIAKVSELCDQGSSRTATIVELHRIAKQVVAATDAVREAAKMLLGAIKEVLAERSSLDAQQQNAASASQEAGDYTQGQAATSGSDVQKSTGSDSR